jgi:hypothetical protein
LDAWEEIAANTDFENQETWYAACV